MIQLWCFKYFAWSHNLLKSHWFSMSRTISIVGTGSFLRNQLWKVKLWPDPSNKSSVIRQKGKSQNGCFKKTKRQIFRKTNISYPLIRKRMCAYQGVKNVRFLEKLASFVFLKHPFWVSSFYLITNELEKVIQFSLSHSNF